MKNKVTSNLRRNEVLKKIKIGLDSKVGIYLRDESFSTDVGIVNLHPSKGTHWVCYINENYFDSYGCTPPKKLSSFIIKRNGYCLYSEYQIQKNCGFCARYCFQICCSEYVLSIVPLILNGIEKNIN